MPDYDDTLSPAVREAYTLARVDVVVWETLEISHPLVATPIYIVRARQAKALTLETGVTVTFMAVAFKFKRPASGQNGLQELQLSIDNVGQRVKTFINTVKDSNVAVTVKWRPYLSDDPSTPQCNPPLALSLRDVVVTTLECTGRATFADIINRPGSTEYYTRARFPSLAN